MGRFVKNSCCQLGNNNGGLTIKSDNYQLWRDISARKYAKWHSKLLMGNEKGLFLYGNLAKQTGNFLVSEEIYSFGKWRFQGHCKTPPCEGCLFAWLIDWVGIVYCAITIRDALVMAVSHNQYLAEERSPSLGEKIQHGCQIHLGSEQQSCFCCLIKLGWDLRKFWAAAQDADQAITPNLQKNEKITS